MMHYTRISPDSLARIGARLKEIGQSRPMMEKTMNTYETIIPPAPDYGRETARQSLPAVDGIRETLQVLIGNITRANATLSEIADRVNGPVPELETGMGQCFDNSLAGGVRELEVAVLRYENLLARF